MVIYLSFLSIGYILNLKCFRQNPILIGCDISILIALHQTGRQYEANNLNHHALF